jgi:hypothetical protein
VDIIRTEEAAERPWIALTTPYDVEAWIEHHNRDLQQIIEKANTIGFGISGYGICLCLQHGGQIFMHTNPEGDVLLDVTPEAEWIAPVITAATQIPTPSSQIWFLPGDKLMQLMLALSDLISASKTILCHDFKIRHY